MVNQITHDGHLIPNLLHFARLLRTLGLKISVGQVTELGKTLAVIDITRRDDFFYTARGLWVTDPIHYKLFQEAFDLFWQGRQRWILSMAEIHRYDKKGDNAEVNEESPAALQTEKELRPEIDDGGVEEENYGNLTGPAAYSPVEVLRHKDFAQFNDEELQTAKRALRQLFWNFEERLTRRLKRADKRARQFDFRATVRKNTAYGGDLINLSWRRRKTKPRSIITICDISGSMEQYSRLFLHFIHLLLHHIKQTEAFVFGTRLTRVTPALRHHDVDYAVETASGLVLDWSGGTRIGQSLKTFNFEWSRRVLGHGAIVLIISDGWERGDMTLLSREIERLSQSCWRLIWLNPMAGVEGYQPLVQGIQTVMPFCDDIMPLHNLHNLEQLVRKLSNISVKGSSALSHTGRHLLGSI